jgi:hypothetical protein
MDLNGRLNFRCTVYLHQPGNSQVDFKERVTARDKTCVMTGPGIVQVCHIIPDVKGHKVCSEYLSNSAELSFQAKYMINTNGRCEAVDPSLNQRYTEMESYFLSCCALHFGTLRLLFCRSVILNSTMAFRVISRGSRHAIHVGCIHQTQTASRFST